ncbi:MAG: hypothetical protein ACRDTA_20875 [Pseudonocardiaceae bacterium]
MPFRGYDRLEASRPTATRRSGRIEPEPLLVSGYGEAESVGGWSAKLGPERGDVLDLIPDSPRSALRHGVLLVPRAEVHFGPGTVAAMDAQQLCAVAGYAPDRLNGGFAQLHKEPQAGAVEHTGVELRETLGRVVSVNGCDELVAVA